MRHQRFIAIGHISILAFKSYQRWIANWFTCICLKMQWSLKNDCIDVVYNILNIRQQHPSSWLLPFKVSWVHLHYWEAEARHQGNLYTSIYFCFQFSSTQRFRSHLRHNRNVLQSRCKNYYLLGDLGNISTLILIYNSLQFQVFKIVTYPKSFEIPCVQTGFLLMLLENVAEFDCESWTKIAPLPCEEIFVSTSRASMCAGKSQTLK